MQLIASTLLARKESKKKRDTSAFTIIKDVLISAKSASCNVATIRMGLAPWKR